MPNDADERDVKVEDTAGTDKPQEGAEAERQDEQQEELDIDVLKQEIEKLRRENARRRIEAKQLKAKLEHPDKVVDPVEPDGRYEKLQRQFNALQINTMAEKKGVDSEVLEALLSKRGIDISEPDSIALVDELIQEKGLVKKRQTFGTAAQRSDSPGKKPKTLDEYLLIQMEELP